jgi:hypothetical protein
MFDFGPVRLLEDPDEINDLPLMLSSRNSCLLNIIAMESPPLDRLRLTGQKPGLNGRIEHRILVGYDPDQG